MLARSYRPRSCSRRRRLRSDTGNPSPPVSRGLGMCVTHDPAGKLDRRSPIQSRSGRSISARAASTTEVANSRESVGCACPARAFIAVSFAAMMAGRNAGPMLARYAPVTRQITSPTSSAISTEPSGPMVTPTGRPYDSRSSGARKPDRISRDGPDGCPFSNGTKTSL
jgi:hypothetical protein